MTRRLSTVDLSSDVEYRDLFKRSCPRGSWWFDPKTCQCVQVRRVRRNRKLPTVDFDIQGAKYPLHELPMDRFFERYVCIDEAQG